MEFINSDEEEGKMNIMSIFTFDIITIIISYIGNKDDNDNNDNNNKFIHINRICYLCSINKHYSNYLKHYYNDFYHSLSKEYSFRFYNDKNFRSIILKKIHDPKKQLSLDLSSFVWNMTYLSNLSACNALNLSYCLLPTDISCLKNIRNLDLSCTSIKDVSPLRDVQNLNLYCCRCITDISNLTNVQILNIRGCSGITSVVGLDSIKKISLCYRQTELIGLRDLGEVIIKWI